MPAAPTSPVELLDLLRKSGIVSPDRLAAAIPDPDALPPEPPKVAAVLVQKGLVTRFQAQQLLAGRHKGFRLGAYAIQDQLGRGGMGAVYLAEHLELHRKVAIKVLVTAKDDDQKLALERFLREARAAAALDHPNIVRIFDVCRHGEVPYLVMEYVEGETIQQVLDRDGAVPYTTAADFIAQAAAGLQHAHEKGFVHRDIKPGNLILDRSGTLKILDMGLARSNTNERDKLTEKLDAGAVVGTADFIAPEQALNLPQIDIRADIYSLGATFFSLITGKPPFEGNTTQKLLHHQMTAAPHLTQIDATLPKGLAGVVAKMLAKKPGDRFQTPAEVIAALTPWLANSAKILAGLSRTNLGQGADLHATLHDLARRSSTRLGLSPGDPHDSGEVNPSDPGRETGPVAAADTTRSPVDRSKKLKQGKAKPARAGVPVWVSVAVLAIVLLVGGAVAWVAFGNRSESPTPSTTAPNPDVVVNHDPLPTPNPNPNPAPEPKPKTADPKPKSKTTTPDPDKPLYQLSLAGQKPFAIRSAVEVNPNNPTQKTARMLSQTGEGAPPKGWTGRCYNPETQMEFFAETSPAGPALGIRNVKGPGSAMLFTPTIDCPTGVCRVRFEYAATVRPGKFALRFKPTNPSALAWDVERPPVTGQVWGSREIVVPLKGATAGFFEFHNTDETPEFNVKVRSFTVYPSFSGAAANVQPNPTTNQPTGPDYRTWTEGAQVYRLDVAAIAPFRVTKEGNTRTAGEPEKLPPGVSARCWKATATGEFRREEIDGAALGLTNFSDQMSAQFAFELEKDVLLKLKPGTTYRVKLSYLTRNDATGSASVQTQDYKSVATTKLTTTGGQWRDTAVVFERKDATPVRLVIDNNAVGEGNTLYFRSVEVVELEPPPAKK